MTPPASTDKTFHHPSNHLPARLKGWAVLLLFFPAVLLVNQVFLWAFPAKLDTFSEVTERFLKSQENLIQASYVYQNRRPDEVFATYYSTLGTQMASRGQMMAAQELLEKAAALSPEDAIVHLNYALVLEALERDADAIAAYDKAVELMPELVIARYNAGLLYDKMGKTNKAIERLKEALAYEPESPFLNYDLGVMYAKKHDFVNSALYSEKAAKASEDFAEAYNNYAYALAHLGRSEEALAMVDKSLEIKPDSAASLDTRGFALQGMQKYEEAIKEYDKALKLDPMIGEIYLHLGQCYEALDNYQKAYRAYEHYLNLTPDALDREETERKISRLKKQAKKTRSSRTKQDEDDENKDS